MKKRVRAINLIVEFNGHLVVLENEDDRQKTNEGVEIWIQKQPANSLRPMASIPAGTLEKYKHRRPHIIDMEWDE